MKLRNPNRCNMCGTLQRGRKLSGQHHRKHLLLGAILPTVVILEGVTLAVAQDTGQANSAVTSIKVDVGLVNLNVSVSDRTTLCGTQGGELPGVRQTAPTR